MRPWIIGAALLAFIALVADGPRFSAGRAQTNRHERLRTLHAEQDLPACPMGEDLDAFLNRIPAGQESATLWVAACREQPLPAGRVIVVSENRAGFAACREQLTNQPKAACSLEEALALLADATRARSIARVKLSDSGGRRVIWVTSQPLAWGDNLVREHRYYLMLALAGLAVCWMVVVTARHSRLTFGHCLAMRVAGGRNVPRLPEFWLMLLLPPYAQSLPVDYRDEYEERLESEGEARANRWYRKMVYASSRDLIAMRMRRLIPGARRSVR